MLVQQTRPRRLSRSSRRPLLTAMSSTLFQKLSNQLLTLKIASLSELVCLCYPQIVSRGDSLPLSDFQEDGISKETTRWSARIQAASALRGLTCKVGTPLTAISQRLPAIIQSTCRAVLRVSWAMKTERNTQWLRHLSERKSLLARLL